MYCVHSRFVRHEVLQVVVDRLRDFDDVSLDLSLKPEAEAGMVNTCFSGYLHLFDVVLVHDIL